MDVDEGRGFVGGEEEEEEMVVVVFGSRGWRAVVVVEVMFDEEEAVVVDPAEKDITLSSTSLIFLFSSLPCLPLPFFSPLLLSSSMSSSSPSQFLSLSFP